MKLLIGIRLKGMFSTLKKSFGEKPGMGVLMAVVLLLAFFSVESMLFSTWGMLAGILETEYAWLFFALGGLLAFAFGIFGTVFNTQSQMYEAKDNELLLAMPIKPGSIVASRVIVLYLLTMLFVVVIMVPGGIIYSFQAGFSVSFWLVYLLSMFFIGLLTQALTCLLGWVLHFLLASFRHKAIVATFFMTIVMVLYFIGIGQLENLMLLLVNNGGKIASAMQSFAWPFYALGAACLGDWLQFGLLALVCGGMFALVTVILNITFIKAMLVGGKSKRIAKQKRDDKVRSAIEAVCRKESKRFFTSITYLVNIGMGLFMIVAFVGAGIWLKDKAFVAMEQMPEVNLQRMVPIIIIGAMGFLASMTPISAPSVSLEGKHIWILRSMPIRGADVLKAKLRFHCIASVPLASVGALVLGIVYEIGWFDTMFTVIGTALLFVLTGVLGLIFNMCFPRLDWPNEATPVKQSMAVFVSIFGMMFVSGIYVGIYFGFVALFGGGEKSLLAFALVNVLFAGITYCLYRVMITWGGEKFETL